MRKIHHIAIGVALLGVAAEMTSDNTRYVVVVALCVSALGSVIELIRRGK